jgi:hypothetical protein
MIAVAVSLLLAAAPASHPSDFGGCALFPVALQMDPSGNAVLDPNETAVMAPTWTWFCAASAPITGIISGLTGPAGPVYTMTDTSANYGVMGPGPASHSCLVTGDCYGVRVTGTRPQTHWDATVTEQTSWVFGPKTWILHVGGSFADVPAASPFYRFVETVFHQDVMGGCTATAWCPQFVVPREHMAVFVLQAFQPTFLPPACVAGSEMFADVPASSPYCRWIEELARRGVVAGCGSGNYCPTRAISRETMAVYLLKTKEGPAYVPPACGTPVFADVPAASPFCPWVEELARRGITGGCTTTNYCPTVTVSREQMSVFLTVTYGLMLYYP